uniref:FERM domain-containing protein n=1 Tax=Vespula pensylvanica TaxID=30213 RepID=A0A834KUH6_VESPE|nr:hypothetical protein H0235_013047 [Vespula pensylvanica]
MRGSGVTAARSCLQPLVSASRYLAVHALPGDPLYFVVEAKSRVKEVYAQTCMLLGQQGMRDCELFGLAILSDARTTLKYRMKRKRGSGYKNLVNLVVFMHTKILFLPSSRLSSPATLGLLLLPRAARRAGSTGIPTSWTLLGLCGALQTPPFYIPAVPHHGEAALAARDRRQTYILLKFIQLTLINLSRYD